MNVQGSCWLEQVGQGKWLGYGGDCASTGILFLTWMTDHLWAGLLPQGQWCLKFTWFHFSTVVQREGWLGPELRSAKRDRNKLNISLTWWWSLLRDEPGHQEEDPGHTHLITMRGTMKPLLTVVATGAACPYPTASLLPTWLIFLIWRKTLLFSFVGLFSLHHFGFVQFGSEPFFPTRWTRAADQSQAKDAQFHLQAGRPFQVSLLRWHTCIQMFEAGLSWWTTWEGCQSGY